MENDELGISDMLSDVLERDVEVRKGKVLMKFEDINKEDLDDDEILERMKGGI